MNRRQFLGTSAAAAVAIVSRGAETMLPIVDTHQHLWDRSQFRLPWIEKGTPLDRDFLPADFAAATNGLNVVKAVYMEVDVAAEQQQAEADFINALIASKKTPTVAAVVAGRPDHDGFRRYVEGFKGSKTIKGIRRVLHVPETSPGTCLSEAFVKGIRLLGTLGLSFDLCLKPGEIPNATKLLDACPDTRFILDHCGNPDVKLRDLSDWKKSIDEMAKRKNVVCKVSGFIVHAPRDKWTAELLAPVVHHVCDSFGPDRVMFGGDWPVCTLTATYRQWVDALKQIVKGKPELDQKKLFHDNAVRFYGL